MWEEVALEYNSRKARSWLERDFDSLRRKFRNLYGKPKPTGNNDGLPPKLRPIALAHEVQHAIEMKGGGSYFSRRLRQRPRRRSLTTGRRRRP
ncbi:hypothetical protein PF003_g7066 [Phytophthora fragariae]|nr:hypothetical protein PF003_g7066 [Phytophthora fragariae]